MATAIRGLPIPATRDFMDTLTEALHAHHGPSLPQPLAEAVEEARRGAEAFASWAGFLAASLQTSGAEDVDADLGQPMTLKTRHR